jgi:hypothetical protein
VKMEYQIFAEGTKIKEIRLSGTQSKALFETKAWKNVDLTPYIWKDGEDKNEISVVNILDKELRWKLQEGILIALLAIGRSHLSEKKSTVESSELISLTDLLFTICDINVDAIRIG